MDESDDPGPESGPVVERGETYDHADRGRVEVTGIWKGVEQADSAHHTEDSGIIIVRYSTEQTEKVLTEPTDTLDEFIAAIETSQ